jgi:hypothetical protein
LKKPSSPAVLDHIPVALEVAARAGQAGGDWEQIQFLLFGHVSVETTDRYPGCKHRFRNAVNDHIGIETD